MRLIENRVEESQRLEYKQELNLSTKAEKREAAKDVSGLANAEGGLLVYGVSEEELPDGRRLPSAATPLQDGGLQAQIEDVLDGSVTPRLNYEARTLETDGGFFLLIHVYPRAGVPHMVDAYGDLRCHIRAGLSTRPMQHRELEAAFATARDASSRVMRRLGRVSLAIAPEGVTKGPDPRRAGGPWLGLAATPLDGPDQLVPMRVAVGDAFPDDGEYPRWYRQTVVPPQFSWNERGYFYEVVDGGLLSRLLRLNRNGVFEWGMSMGSRPNLPSASITELVHDILGYFATCYARCSYFGRIRLWLRLEQALDVELGVGDGEPVPWKVHPLTSEELEWSGDSNVERLLHDAGPATHEAMDQLWISFGYNRCELFDLNGAPGKKLELAHRPALGS